ncbi:Uncharacterized protein R423 [Durusdinium trenchii]|uniref:Uncharacterized protein R423 n=1 Tax=Durusdinium trenchii TaxID=1381693 RepID=A0ABP0IMI0_9DINO
MKNEDVSEGSRELVDLSAEVGLGTRHAISSLGFHLSQVGQIISKFGALESPRVQSTLPPQRGDRSAAFKLKEKLEMYQVTGAGRPMDATKPKKRRSDQIGKETIDAKKQGGDGRDRRGYQLELLTPPRVVATSRRVQATKSRSIAKQRLELLATQRDEADEVVEVLCFSCRRAKDNRIQKSMTSFLKKAAFDLAEVIDLDADEPTDPSICARCRRPLWKKNPELKPTPDALRGSGELPQLQRLRAYRRTAERQGVPFTISEKTACAMMRSPCIACGAAAPLRGHGLTRLRRVAALPGARKGFMGPYSEENLAPACTMCNMMKGYRRLRAFVECCRHIATKHTEGEDFGEYPHRFRDNVSKRSRSCYISQSSTHTKTHSLTNEQFNAIVAQRCFYCHKEPRKPKSYGPEDRGHFNGLDRLDSKNRVYMAETSVAACGDCNIMKYRWDLEEFLQHCREVARFHHGKDRLDSTTSNFRRSTVTRDFRI